MPSRTSSSISRSCIRFVSCTLAIALSWVTHADVNAQTAPAKSVIAFELKPRQLAGHPLVRLAAKNANPEAKRLAKAERILGYASVPNDLKLLQDLSVDQAIPFDFVITIDFASKSDRLAAIGEDELQYLERITKKGKTFYTYPSDNSNLVLIVEDMKVELGTSNYMSMKDRDFATPELTKQFASMQSAPLRVATDLDGARTFINSALALQLKNGKPPAWIAPFLEVPKKSQAMNLSIDLESDPMLKFESHSATESDAQYVAKAFKAVVGLMQLGLKEDKKAGQIGQALLANAQHVAESNVAVLTIKKPEKLEELISKVNAPE